MKKVLIALVALGLIGAGIGIYMFNKTVPSTASMNSDYIMGADELLSAFENDENSANLKYLDKVIQVQGSVEKFETKDGKTTVYLNADNPLSNIICQLEEPISNITQGQSITLKGICTGYLMDVVLVRAVTI
jgi:hypothetical protein